MRSDGGRDNGHIELQAGRLLCKMLMKSLTWKGCTAGAGYGYRGAWRQNKCARQSLHARGEMRSSTYRGSSYPADFASGSSLPVQSAVGSYIAAGAASSLQQCLAPNLGLDSCNSNSGRVAKPDVAKVLKEAKLGDVDDALYPDSAGLAALSEDGNDALKAGHVQFTYVVVTLAICWRRSSSTLEPYLLRPLSLTRRCHGGAAQSTARRCPLRPLSLMRRCHRGAAQSMARGRLGIDCPSSHCI